MSASPAQAALRRASPDAAPAAAADLAADLATYHDVARIIERMHRRFLDVVRIELERRGVEDLSSVQALMLMLIGCDELSVRDLMERGYYLGSNASYNLKTLVEAGYVDRGASQRDRRAARLRLSERGRWLHDELRQVELAQARAVVRSPDDLDDLVTAYRVLRRLERAWSDSIRYSSSIE